MSDLENAKTEVQDVHYSRYIASWQNEGGHYYGEQFEKWLKANGCTDDEINRIKLMATIGKLELEVSAKAYINKMNKMIKIIDNGGEPEEEP